MKGSDIGCLTANLCALIPPLGQIVVNYKNYTNNEFYFNSTLSIPTVWSYLLLYVSMAVYFLICDDSCPRSWSRGWIVAYFGLLAIMYLYICLQWYGFRRFSSRYNPTNRVPSGTITYVDYGTEHSAAVAADFGLSSEMTTSKSHQGLDPSLPDWDGRSTRSITSLRYNAPVLAALLAISPIPSANALPIQLEGTSGDFSSTSVANWLAISAAALFFLGKSAQLVKHFTAKCVVGVSVLFYLCEMLQLTLMLCTKNFSVLISIPLPHDMAFTCAFLLLDTAILSQFALYQRHPRVFNTPLQRLLDTSTSNNSRLVEHDLLKPNLYTSVREN